MEVSGNVSTYMEVEESSDGRSFTSMDWVVK